MAEKGFGVKEVNLIGASGTPTITSPNNLNLNAVNVAISTNATVGGTLSVTGNVSVGGTLTYEDVTSIDSVGIITARSVIHAGAGLTVVGVSTFNSDVHLGLHGAGNPKIHFDESGDLLWFKKQTAGGSSTKIGLGGGTSYDHLQLQQTYTGGGQSEITAYNSNILVATYSAEKNITIQSTNDITLANGSYPFIKCEENSSSDQSVTLYHGQTGSTPYANPKLVTANTGVVITGICTATSFSGSGASLTNLPAATPTNSDIQVVYTVTANGSSAYRFAGNGVVSTADDPDLYLIRGQKYRFINNSGGSHPFQIRQESGGTAYSTGVTNNGAASGNIDFAPTFDSPAQLVYQCTSHSGMVGNIYLKDGNGNETNVGVTTFSGQVHLNQLKKASGTLDYLAATHNFANAAGSTNYFTVSNTDATLTGSTDGVLNLDTTDSRGSFIRFKENGTSKTFVGCGEGLSLGDQDDLGLRATDKIIMRAGSTESLRIDGGKLLVGRTNSITFSGDATDHNFEQLTNNGYTMGIHANQAEQRGIALYYTTGKSANPFIGARIGSSWKFILRGDGDCENANNSYGGISDVSLKENIVNANSQWDDIKNIKIRNYNFKASTGQPTHTQIGVIAQELETVSPKLVKVSEDDMRTVSYSVLYLKAVKALQEAMARIETLEAEVAALKAK